MVVCISKYHCGIHYGDYLADSGWNIALNEAGIQAAADTADGFLNANHLTSTRHAHQVTVAALSKLQHVAFSLANTEENFEAWKVIMTQQYLTFQFWDTVMRMELLILMFVRAHREKKIELYVETLEELASLFFALVMLGGYQSIFIT